MNRMHLDALLRAKAVLMADFRPTTGSTDPDWRSFLHNQELTAVIPGTGFGEKMLALFGCDRDRDLAVADGVAPDAWERRSVGTRARNGSAA